MVLSYPHVGNRSELKEQLRLFAFSKEPVVPELVAHIVHEGLTKRERLATLLEGELNFHGENSTYASHDLHAFAAKFPPQLPRVFIRGLTSPGELVVDPMMGSGTTVVEAVLEGRRTIGLDIDPLAIRLTSVKTTPLNIENLQRLGSRVMTRANSLVSTKKVGLSLDRFEDRTREFVDYWFLPNTQRELMALKLAIDEVDEDLERQFLEITFSSIIVTKSGGVSRARDLAHSRPHLDKTKMPKNALEKFRNRFQKNIVSLAQLKANGTHATAMVGDARRIPLKDAVADLIVTSPPYANAIDYMRAHKFSLVWFGETVSNLAALRSEYIGSEKAGDVRYATLPERPSEMVHLLEEVDTGKARILRKYFVEMRIVFSEMHRVLKPDSAAVVVVGTSTTRGIEIKTHECLADIAASVGFEVVGVAERTLDRNKRMMPARFGTQRGSLIEQRMHAEYVLGLLKSSQAT